MEISTETKTARIRFAGSDQFVAESPSGHALVTGFSAQGGSAPSPMELLLISLGGCTGADVISILQKKRQKVTGYEIEVHANRKQEHPRIYTEIEVIHKVTGVGVEEKAVAHAIELSETKYCSVSAMLGASAKITSRFEINETEHS
jgi:putative redox protein